MKCIYAYAHMNVCAIEHPNFFFLGSEKLKKKTQTVSIACAKAIT